MKNKVTGKKIVDFIYQNSSLFVFLLLILTVHLLNSNFLTVGNLLNVLRQSSINGLIAFGMTVVILTAGIDLSVGSILAFSGAATALMLQSGMHPLLTFIAGMFIGALIGAGNGVLIAYGKLQPFIVTLSTMTIFRGLTLVLTQGKPVSILGTGSFFENLGSGYFLEIPIPIFILFFFYAVLWFTLHKTIAGRYVYALGGNEQASYIAGIKVNSVKIFVYAVSGTLSTIAGMILISRLNSSQPTLGVGFELEAIAAVVIGGTTLSGGRGRITGTLLGLLIIGVLNNSLNLMGVSAFYQQVVKGLVILIAVLLDVRKKNRRIL